MTMDGVVVFFLLVSVLSKTVSEVWASEDSEDLTSNTQDTQENTSGDSLNGPFWKKLSDTRSESDHRSFHSDSSELNLPDQQDDLTQITFREFLQLYAKKQNKKPVSNDDPKTHNLDKVFQNDRDNVNTKDKSKSWTLIDVQRHKHPFEEKKGWVSLEPIPWSVSKISKWQSKYKPASDRPWDEHGPISSQRPYIPEDDDAFDFKRPISITPPNPYKYHQQPTEASDKYNFYDHVDRPRPTPSPNINPRPTAFYGHKVHVEAHYPSNFYSSTGKPYSYHNQKDCRHPNHPYDEIMTDGMAPNFPEPTPYESLKRRGTEMEIYSDTYPFQGDGEWVLLSTTKGYKPPRNRQRSLDIGATQATSEDAQSLRTTRGIRLTVLPPLKGSKVNMTTSHGGLLQVESTFESVEQAKQTFDKKQKALKIKGKRKRRKNVKQPNYNKLLEEIQPSLAAMPKSNLDPGAVVAAVGAGMIPATMAMMVPIAMSG